MGILSRWLGDSDDEETVSVEVSAECEKVIDLTTIRIHYTDGEVEELTFYSRRKPRDSDVREYYDATGLTLKLNGVTGLSESVTTELSTEVRMPEVKKIEQAGGTTRVLYAETTAHMSEDLAETMKEVYDSDGATDLSTSRT